MPTLGKIAKFGLAGNLVDSIITEVAQGLTFATGNFILDSGDSPILCTGTDHSEPGRYLRLINSLAFTSASGLKAGGILVADSYSYANPGKNDLVVKGNVGIGTPSPSVRTEIEGTDDQGATLAIGRSDNNRFIRLGVGTQGVALDFDPTSFFVIQRNTLGIGGVFAGQERYVLHVTATSTSPAPAGQ